MRLLFAFVTLAALCATPKNYFPPGALSSEDSVEQLKRGWYTAKLTALHEDSLWRISQQQSSVEAYRFLWLRTFHHPMSIRLTLTNTGTGLLETKETDGYGGFPKSGKLVRDDRRMLSSHEVTRFFGDLETLRFWEVQNEKESITGPDGSQWVLEGAKNGKYRLVDIWTPAASAPMRAVGIALLDLAHITIPVAEVY